MNKKQKIFAILAALFLFGFTFRKRKGGNAIPQTNNALKNKLIEIATREKELWQNGTIKENNPTMLAKLRQYWGAVGQGNKAASAIVGDAWSAAFISWVMREAGVDWQPSARHSSYFQWAKQNRANNTGSKDKLCSILNHLESSDLHFRRVSFSTNLPIVRMLRCGFQVKPSSPA